jgi:hypothetical protein
MAKVKAVLGDKSLPAFFSGHQSRGGAARAGGSARLTFA